MTALGCRYHGAVRSLQGGSGATAASGLQKPRVKIVVEILAKRVHSFRTRSGMQGMPYYLPG